MTTWSDLPTFVPNDVITATQLNQLRYQIRRIRQPEVRIHDLVGPFTKTPNTTFVTLDATTEKTFSLERAAWVLVMLMGSYHTVPSVGTNLVYMDIELNGSRVGHTTDGLVSLGGSSPVDRGLTFVRLLNLSSGSNTIKIMIRGTSATDQLILGASAKLQYSIRIL